jgi:hypothetical protein
MKPATATAIRILVVLALAAVEAIGVLHFRGRPGFTGFAILSAWLICVIAPTLCIEAFWRQGVSWLQIAIVSIFGFWALSWWAEGDLIYGALAGVAFLVGVARLVQKMLRPLDEERRQEYVRLLRPADAAFLRVGLNTAGLLACFVGWAKMWPHPNLKIWAMVLTIPALWFAWRLIARLFFAPKSKEEVTQID